MGERSTIRVLCVDDNFLVGEGVAMTLRMVPGFEWTGQLTSADRLIAEAARRNVDVVLLDIDLPGRDPFEALTELCRSRPHTRTIIFTGLFQRDTVDRAVEAGAWGYLVKGDTEPGLAEAIRRVMNGEFVTSTDVEATYPRLRPQLK